MEAHLLPDVLALNQRFAVEMSAATEAELARLIEAAVYVRVVGAVDGFILAFDQDTAIEGENLGWFKARFPHFLYCDRVAVAPHAQGRGIGRALYRDLFAFAFERGYPLIACEVNIAPPNPASDALHAALGFREAGQQTLRNGKRVRYLVKDVAARS